MAVGSLEHEAESASLVSDAEMGSNDEDVRRQLAALGTQMRRGAVGCAACVVLQLAAIVLLSVSLGSLLSQSRAGRGADQPSSTRQRPGAPAASGSLDGPWPR